MGDSFLMTFRNIEGKLSTALEQKPKKLGDILSPIRKLRQLLSQNPIFESLKENPLFASNLHITLLKTLDPQVHQNNSKLMVEIMSCFSNICFSNQKYLQILFDLDLIGKVKHFLKGWRVKIVEGVFWMLSNFTSQFPLVKKTIYSNGYVDLILQNVETLKDSPKLSAIIAWFSSNLAQNLNSEDLLNVQKLLLGLKFLFYNKIGSEVVQEMTWAVNYFLDNDAPDCEFIVNQLGLIQQLKKIFYSNQIQTIYPITRIFGKLSMGKAQIINSFLDDKFKKSITAKLLIRKPVLKMHLLWMMENIIFTGSKQAQIFNDKDFFELLRIIILEKEGPVFLKNFALSCFKNLFSNLEIDDREKLIFQYRFTDCILFCLEIFEKEIILNALQCLQKILKHGVTVFDSR